MSQGVPGGNKKVVQFGQKARLRFNPQKLRILMEFAVTHAGPSGQTLCAVLIQLPDESAGPATHPGIHPTIHIC